MIARSDTLRAPTSDPFRMNRPHHRLLLLPLLGGVALTAAAQLPPVAMPPAPSASTATLPQPPRLAPAATVPPAPMHAVPAHAASTPRPERTDPAAARTIERPLFGAITLYAPKGPVRGLALFLSGDGGWNLGVWQMAQEAAAKGMWVAGFSTPHLLASLDHDPAPCTDAAGVLKGLAADLEQTLGLPRTLPVGLIGYSSGATVVYAALVQAQPAEFQGGISLGFCPDLVFRKRYCPGAGDLTWTRAAKPPHTLSFNRNPHVAAPWTILQGSIDEVCAPHFTPDFATGVIGARGVLLPHVGHGFGVPRNWLPQYRQALDELLAGQPTP